MAFDQHKNFSYSTVATAPSPALSGTSLVVQAGDGALFPAAPFNATVWPAGVQPSSTNGEVVRVTNVATDTFTITRAQESSSARSITVGDQIAATITAKTLTDVEKAAGTLNTVAASGASQTINYSTANTWDITLTANCTFTLSGFTSGDPDYLTLILRQDATGSRTVTWPTITWIGTGLAPTLQTAASSVDSVVLFSVDGGTTVYGIAQTSASGLRSGTAFPGSPADGDLFYRTDRRILYEYDSTSTHWLSLDRKYVPFGPGDILAAGGTTAGVLGWLPIFEDVYVESWNTASLLGGTNNGSNFWTLTLKADSAAEVQTTLSSFTTASDTASQITLHNVSIASVWTAASSPAVFIISSKTGTPSGFRGASTLVLRSVG